MKKLLLLITLLASVSVVAQTNTSSISFDGVDDYVSVYSSSTINNTFNGTNPFTLSFWLNLDDDMGYQELFSKGQYWTDAREQLILLIESNGSLSFILYTGNTANWIRTNIAESNLNTNIWDFYTCTYDGGNTASSLHIYKNGIEINGTTTNTGTFTGIIQNSDSLYIGCRLDNAGNNILFTDGHMDDISIWNTALDSTQIQQYMLCPPIGNEAGLVGYWNFEESTGTTAGDLTSNGNDGTLTNGPTWSTDVPVYNCGVGINQTTISSSHIILFPNPSNSSVTVQGEEISAGQISVIDILGATVYKTSFFSNPIDIDLNQIGSKGTYFVKVLDNEGNIISVEKLIYQ